MVLQAGDLVWRNKDPALDAQARASYESLSSTEMRKVPVDATLAGSLGQVWHLHAILPEPCEPQNSAVLPLVKMARCWKPWGCQSSRGQQVIKLTLLLCIVHEGKLACRP